MTQWVQKHIPASQVDKVLLFPLNWIIFLLAFPRISGIQLSPAEIFTKHGLPLHGNPNLFKCRYLIVYFLALIRPPVLAMFNAINRKNPADQARMPKIGFPPEENFEPAEGFEPSTHGLQNRCSTSELSRQCVLAYPLRMGFFTDSPNCGLIPEGTWSISGAGFEVGLNQTTFLFCFLLSKRYFGAFWNQASLL